MFNQRTLRSHCHGVCCPWCRLAKATQRQVMRNNDAGDAGSLKRVVRDGTQPRAERVRETWGDGFKSRNVCDGDG